MKNTTELQKGHSALVIGVKHEDGNQKQQRYKSNGRKVRTVSQACDVDLAEVQCGCHGNIEGALGNVISTVSHSNSQWTLGQEGGSGT